MLNNNKIGFLKLKKYKLLKKNKLIQLAINKFHYSKIYNYNQS